MWIKENNTIEETTPGVSTNKQDIFQTHTSNEIHYRTNAGVHTDDGAGTYKKRLLVCCDLFLSIHIRALYC